MPSMIRILLLTACLVSFTKAAPSSSLKSEIPFGAHDDIVNFIDKTASTLESTERNMLSNALGWLKDEFALQDSALDGDQKLTTWLQGKSLGYTIAVGYVRHREELQKLIDELSVQHLAEIARARNPSLTADQLIVSRQQTAKTKTLLHALVQERDQLNVDLETFMHPNGMPSLPDNTSATLPPAPR